MKLNSVDSNPVINLRDFKTPAPGEGRQGGIRTTAVEEKEEKWKDPQEALESINQAVEQLNNTMKTYHTELHFELHEKSGEYMVKVMKQPDGTVIREIPPEKILDMVAYFKEMLGIIVDKLI
ncbi:flagellar protein FlaG [Desulfallas sp. Bu1-1]|uniref:flagellar protein FlaG n=1 Tax=Desulfallas sp. Bu1-1 TaxID=2787620 RepID=UPI00189D61AC|nr:flagellar protein FlaG [Desulfallas sp. Bu1-1]MBF7081968.1 flagellar protein FlaG [Desulfallas sp. Bu1-1]